MPLGKRLPQVRGLSWSEELELASVCKAGTDGERERRAESGRACCVMSKYLGLLPGTFITDPLAEVSKAQEQSCPLTGVCHMKTI